MDLTTVLHKRVLVAEKDRGFSNKQTVEEIKILEIAPSGNWIKIQNMNGNKYWRHVSDINVIEVLNMSIDKPQ